MRIVKKLKDFVAKVKKKVQEFREKREQRRARPTLVNWIFHNLDDCILTAYVENSELVVKIAPKAVAV